MTKTAWIFPGQGSQKIGMGAGLFEQSDLKTKLELAENILGWSISEICSDPEDKISKTLYTQPCLYVVETLLVDRLKQEGQSPDYVAGHSLGEYVALYAAGVFDFETGLTLVKRRAELMDSADGGQMAALIGFNSEQLQEQIQKTDNVVLANDNSAAQVVISGTPEAVDQVLANIKVKRAVKLNVSGAFHSPLMAEAATEFQRILDEIPFNNAQVPVLSNVDPTPTTDASLLKQRLTQQMTGSVRWREICLQLSELEVQQVVEIGPGNVLTGLMKRTFPEIVLQNIS
ncbi:Malonyl CoA-acyl carrier protein transacylase [Planktothrix tepida]|uniref:Malonyl CoA-acyl carrier protein transacylase n=2 Tax=Planktothrix TaxID=54304 RepID=A0A1J1LM56_9CYAN|nr:MULTISPECIES: ACP S-malonyltransferase [Planktothrix]CAD5942508.1 Malonyl CoA-acyl carrier protein transacylase [Planktothrix tepida]CAD5968954.1 Malonyl CoA-acyl carrier protein transacylase [Planktothrix pseudagardhii]CUR33020.1 Malonyl CoA-acyl carrier protein transacylase [Planktothrix tepida PCC 9214]